MSTGPTPGTRGRIRAEMRVGPSKNREGRPCPKKAEGKVGLFSRVFPTNTKALVRRYNNNMYLEILYLEKFNLGPSDFKNFTVGFHISIKNRIE